MSEDCSICLDAIQVSSTGRVELSCNHTYHLKCISKWMTKSNQCPNCRNTVSEMEKEKEKEKAKETPIQRESIMIFPYQGVRGTQSIFQMLQRELSFVNLDESFITQQDDSEEEVEIQEGVGETEEEAEDAEDTEDAEEAEEAEEEAVVEPQLNSNSVQRIVFPILHQDIPIEDVELVMAQTNVNSTMALESLRRCNGDIVHAIMMLIPS